MVIETGLIIKGLGALTSAITYASQREARKEAEVRLKEAETDIGKVITGGIVGVVVFIFLTIIEKIFF